MIGSTPYIFITCSQTLHLPFCGVLSLLYFIYVVLKPNSYTLNIRTSKSSVKSLLETHSKFFSVYFIFDISLELSIYSFVHTNIFILIWFQIVSTVFCLCGFPTDTTLSIQIIAVACMFCILFHVVLFSSNVVLVSNKAIPSSFPC